MTALIEPIEDKEHLVAVVRPHGQVHLLLSSNLVDMVDVMNKVDIDMVDVMKMVDMVDVVNPHGQVHLLLSSNLFFPQASIFQSHSVSITQWYHYHNNHLHERWICFRDIILDCSTAQISAVDKHHQFEMVQVIRLVAPVVMMTMVMMLVVMMMMMVIRQWCKKSSVE